MKKDLWKVFGPQDDRIEFFKKFLTRARELGRNVARAMMIPIEEVKYVGEKSGVACPACQSNILHAHEELPYVTCPICAVRGEITTEGGKMKVKWSEEDAKKPRFSYEGDSHRGEWLAKHYFANPQYFKAIEELTEKYREVRENHQTGKIMIHDEGY